MQCLYEWFDLTSTLIFIENIFHDFWMILETMILALHENIFTKMKMALTY